MDLSTQTTSRALPRLAAVGAALVGAINVASALTPNIRWRGHLLLQYEPVQAMRWRFQPASHCCWSRRIWPSAAAAPGRWRSS
jgi:hypothetical protein